MAGCFGNHPVDRWIENELFRYLDSFDEKRQCEICGFEAQDDDWDYDEETEELICPECGHRIKL